MNNRPREDDEIEELLNDLSYLWEAQGPSGQSTGINAMEELLWRWEYLPYDWWEKQQTLRSELLLSTPQEMAVATIAHEAENRGHEHDLFLDLVYE